MVKTLPSNAWGEGSIPGQEAKIPHASKSKTQNIKLCGAAWGWGGGLGPCRYVEMEGISLSPHNSLHPPEQCPHIPPNPIEHRNCIGLDTK